jgi:hypothetical protein
MELVKQGKPPQVELSLVEFGRQLITTGDLDPVYIILQRAEFPKAKLQNWLLAYWCFYHCGTASWITDQSHYWRGMKVAAGSRQYARSSERRHFRGAFAVKVVNELAKTPVERRFEALTIQLDDELTLAHIMGRVKRWYGFGDWIAFKVADMLERLGLAPVVFDEADTFLFDSPAKGAALAAERMGVKTVNPSGWAFNYLQQNLGNLAAPPRFEREVNGQEFETILCKIKSHWEGRYEVGHDWEEVKAGLQRYKECPTAQHLLTCCNEFK